MRKIDILFLVEHVDRELDAATCLAELLYRRFGVVTEIRNFYSDMHYCLTRYEPAVVVTPFFYFLDHHPMKDYFAAWPAAVFFNMAWEQILYKMNETVKVPKDTCALGQVHHVCWTEKYRDLIAELGVRAELLHLTGNPVMKFYDHPYRSYFKSRGQLAASYGLDPTRKWVLFPENYRWAFLSDGQIRSFLAQDARSDYLTAAREYCIRSFDRLCDWLQELDRPDDPIVILRPRPATATDLIEDFMRRAAPRGCPNVRIVKSESAREWIIAADHVISSYSTTLIEAALAQKPVHLFSPEPFPEALFDEWYALVPKLQNGEDLVSAIRLPHRAANSSQLGEWARKTLLPAGDPIQLIAEQLARLCPTRQTRESPFKPQNLTTIQSISERTRKWLQRSERYHEYLRRRDPRYAFTVQKHEKDVFSAHDVIARVSRWQLAAEQSRSESQDECFGPQSRSISQP